jgi:hypothetical protein
LLGPNRVAWVFVPPVKPEVVVLKAEADDTVACVHLSGSHFWHIRNKCDVYATERLAIEAWVDWLAKEHDNIERLMADAWLRLHVLRKADAANTEAKS